MTVHRGWFFHATKEAPMQPTSQPTLSSGWAKLVVENQLTHEQYVTITPDDVVTSRPEIIVRLTPAYADDE